MEGVQSKASSALLALLLFIRKNKIKDDHLMVVEAAKALLSGDESWVPLQLQKGWLLLLHVLPFENSQHPEVCRTKDVCVEVYMPVRGNIFDAMAYTRDGMGRVCRRKPVELWAGVAEPTVIESGTTSLNASIRQLVGEGWQWEVCDDLYQVARKASYFLLLQFDKIKQGDVSESREGARLQLEGRISDALRRGTMFVTPALENGDQYTIMVLQHDQWTEKRCMVVLEGGAENAKLTSILASQLKTVMSEDDWMAYIEVEFDLDGDGDWFQHGDTAEAPAVRLVAVADPS